MYPVSLFWPWSVWIQPNHRNSYCSVTCVLFTIVASFRVSAAKPYEFIWFGDMYPVYHCGLILCECSQAIWINTGLWHVSCSLLWPYSVWMQPNHWKSYVFADMYPVHYCCLIWSECSQNIGIHVAWCHVFCSVWPCLVWMQPNHQHAHGSVTCILFISVALFGVDAAKA